MKRITFVDAEFKNFLSYGNTYQTFRYTNGISIIQGCIVESNRSNGSGKCVDKQTRIDVCVDKDIENEFLIFLHSKHN